MAFRRASALHAALTVSILAASATAALAQDKRKLSKDELAQFQGLHTVVDAVAAGTQPAPAEAKISFRNDFLRSGQDIYVPYTIDVEPGKLTPPLLMYVRAVSKNPAAGAAPAAGAGRSGRSGGDQGRSGGQGRVAGNAPAGGVLYAFEDVAFVTPKPDNTVQRALQLMPGDYDVYIALSEPPGKDKNAPAPKASVLKQPLTVPNLLTGLNTSTIILAKNIEPSGSAQLSGQEQMEQPYTISGYKITPSPVSSFSKTAELLWVFYIYNEAPAGNNKPDVSVDYNFFRAGEEKPFVNMPSSAYNATTLPPEFNLSAGHTIFVAQGVPLTTFNPGDYKLQIKVTDKTNNESVTRDVSFSVTP